MANSSEILQHILQTPPASPVPITYQFLLPNVKGLDNFLASYESFSTSKQGAYPTPPPSPDNDNGSALNPNAMPSASSGADASGADATSSSRAPSDIPDIELSIFTAATESFTQKNTNCSIAE